MSEKKKYDLCFTYNDSDAYDYSNYLELTDAEVVTLESALQSLVDAGYIHNPNGDMSTENMLIPYTEPVFIGFVDIKRDWQKGSFRYVLEDIKFDWNVNSVATIAPDS
jgi:hypothetical protein